MPRTGEIAVALSMAVAALTAGYALYSHVKPAEVNRVAQENWLAVPTAPVGEPLRVANPFDATEIFEFPAGTTEADANEAVAGFLIERAARRGVAGGRRHPGSKG